MAEAQEVCFNQETFQQIEQDVLNQVMATSKAMLETFKFRMLYGIHVTKKQNQETLDALKQFREKYAKNVGKDEEAYKKYLHIY